MSGAAGLLLVAPAAAFLMTAFNAATWRRGRPDAYFGGRVSVLVPARNEAKRLPATLRAIAASAHPVHEIVVYDDGSTDDSGAVLATLREEIPALRVLSGTELPAGWVGKPHACARLAEAATGDVLVFVDADVRLAPDGLARLASIHESGVDLVTAVPKQVTRSPVEALVVPFLLLSYLSWLPLELVARTRDERVVAANGQLLSIDRRALLGLGGFEVVRDEIVDDVALARQAKRAGLRVAIADGTAMASCRMYESGRAVWEGFSKNIHEGVGGSRALVGVVALYILSFILPWLALAASAWYPTLFLPAVCGVAANVAQRTLLAAHWRQSWWGLVHHSAGAMAVIAIAFNSLIWSARGEIRWAGRRYAARSLRQLPPTGAS